MLLFLSCLTEAPSPQRTYITQLHHVQENPHDWMVCNTISSVDLLVDCMLFSIPHISQSQGEELCSQIPRQEEECYFLVAETHLQPSLCSKTPRFQLDCEMHILTTHLREKNRTDYALLLQELGRPADDLYGWTAIYRHLLWEQYPLDTHWCTQQQFPDVCTKALYGTYTDRIHRLFRCNKQHPKLAYEHDETLKKIYEQRQKQCL